MGRVSSNIIPRDFRLSPQADFDLNVEDKIGPNDGVVPVFNKDGYIIGWSIKPIITNRRGRILTRFSY